jgi:chorismate synthase
VPAASVVLENVIAFEIARAMLDKFGGDTLDELIVNYRAYLKLARTLPLRPPVATIA